MSINRDLTSGFFLFRFVYTNHLCYNKFIEYEVGCIKMKKHHMILDVQEELRLRSIKDVANFEKISYDKDINTQGIIEFIKKDSDAIKHFITHQVNWFDHQQVILQYFNDVVEEYDRNAVIEVLESHGFRNRDTKCFLLCTLHPLFVAIPITIIMCVGMGLTFGTMLMVFILLYTFIAAIPFSYVMFYESKRLV